MPNIHTSVINLLAILEHPASKRDDVRVASAMHIRTLMTLLNQHKGTTVSANVIDNLINKAARENQTIRADKDVRKHGHYFKPCPYEFVDVYRVLSMFEVKDQALGHAIKKLLVAGGRGGGKDSSKDIQEAIDTLQRYQEMRIEDEREN